MMFYNVMQMYDVVICFLYLLDDIQNKLKKEKEKNGRVPIFFCNRQQLEKIFKNTRESVLFFPKILGQIFVRTPYIDEKNEDKKIYVFNKLFLSKSLTINNCYGIIIKRVWA